MTTFRVHVLGALCGLALASPALAEPATPTIGSIAPLAVDCAKAFTLTVTGVRFATDAAVWINGRAVTTVFVSATQLKASATVTEGGSTMLVKVVSKSLGTSAANSSVKVGKCATATPPATTPPVTTPPTTKPPETKPPVVTPPVTPPPAVDTPAPAPDAAQIAAARLLEQSSFGASPADIALVKSMGANAWLAQQFAMPASALPVTTDLAALRNNWYMNMATGKDQLRQRMIFALSQVFVVSADKNPYANEIQPWLATLGTHAFGNFKNLLREMSLNPAMGKYLDMGNSILPAPNENYAREVMQLFTLGPNLLNQDGSVQTDRNGDPIPTYDQARIGDMARALSGWTYAGTSTTGINFENFTGPLQPRDKYHDKSAKTLVGDIHLPAGQTAQQDFDAVIDALFQHPNLPPFIATRLIRHFVTSNPSPAYITRVADVFAHSANGRGDLAATLQAVLTDPEARSAAASATRGHLKDPMLHTIGLMRAMNATVVAPANLFWDYFLVGQKIANAPSVFNFYSPMTHLPGSPTAFGPEFQIYAPSLAVARANLLYKFIDGEYASMVKLDIAPYVTAAANPGALVNLVDATLLAGRMSPAARAAILTAVHASTDNKQRALTALYLTAISAEFAVSQ